MTPARRCLLDWLEPLPPGLSYSRALRGPPPPPSWSRRERAARVSKQPEPGKSRSGSVRVLQGSGREDAGLSSYLGVNIGVRVLGRGEPSAWRNLRPLAVRRLAPRASPAVESCPGNWWRERALGGARRGPGCVLRRAGGG